MKKASEYRQHAAEGRKLAAKMEHPKDREQLLGMAAQWDQLAEDRERAAEGLEDPKPR